MQRGQVDLVIVGSDRTLGRTGEVANKIAARNRFFIGGLCRGVAERGL